MLRGDQRRLGEQAETCIYCSRGPTLLTTYCRTFFCSCPPTPSISSATWSSAFGCERQPLPRKAHKASGPNAHSQARLRSPVPARTRTSHPSVWGTVTKGSRDACDLADTVRTPNGLADIPCCHGFSLSIALLRSGNQKAGLREMAAHPIPIRSSFDQKHRRRPMSRLHRQVQGRVARPIRPVEASRLATWWRVKEEREEGFRSRGSCAMERILGRFVFDVDL